MQEVGPDWWCGYSYSWFGNMKARAFDGEGAAQALKTFAECFCLPNTFHANGDRRIVVSQSLPIARSRSKATSPLLPEYKRC